MTSKLMIVWMMDFLGLYHCQGADFITGTQHSYQVSKTAPSLTHGCALEHFSFSKPAFASKSLEKKSIFQNNTFETLIHVAFTSLVLSMGNYNKDECRLRKKSSGFILLKKSVFGLLFFFHLRYRKSQETIAHILKCKMR